MTGRFFLIDSGSSTSTIIQASEYQPDDGLTLQTANGQAMQSEGITELCIDICNLGPIKHTFQIFPAIKENIIGQDFLRTHGIVIDFHKEQITKTSQERTMYRPKLKPDLQDLQNIDHRVRQIIINYKKIYDLNTIALDPPHNLKFSVELTDETPIRIKTRPIPISMRPEALKLLRKYEQLNIIERVYTSEWILPTRFVEKANKKELRLCLDLRRINSVSKTFDYPLPNLFTFQERLRGTKFISKIDLKSGYYLMAIKKESKKYFVFSTMAGLFALNRLPMGHRNSASYFQMLIDSIFGDMQDSVITYLDDLLLYSRTETAHKETLNEVFRRLNDNNLIINVAKSEFFRSSTEFLGMHVSTEGIKPAQKHLEKVANFHKPRTKKEMKQFLGLFNFNRKFFHAASHYTAPLSDLLDGKNKKRELVWNTEAEKAFDKFKTYIKTHSQLTYFNQNADLILYTDASSLALSGALFQDEEGRESPLGFCSKTLDATEKSWSIFELEMAAIKFSIHHFRIYLYGRPFQVRCDNSNVVNTFKKKVVDLSPRATRMYDFIVMQSPEISYIKTTHNKVADYLTRTNATFRLTIPQLDYSKIAEEQKEDTQLQQYLNNPNSTGLQLVQRELENDIKITGDMNEKGRFRTYVPRKARLRVFRFMHDSAGHAGIKRGKKIIKESFIWPYADRDITTFTKTCEACQRAKITKNTKIPPPLVFSAPMSRMACIHIDHVEMQRDGQYKYLLTMIDRTTSFPIAVPQRSMKATETFKNLIKYLISYFGVPRVIVSDRGSAFVSKEFRDGLASLGIEHRLTTAYNPRCAGKIERFHRTLKSSLKTLAKTRDWVEGLPLVMLGLRSCIHTEGGYTPCEMLLGQNPRLPGLLIDPEDYAPFTTEHTKKLIEFLDATKQQINKLKKQKKYLPKSLLNCKMVMVKHGKLTSKEKDTYFGPQLVINRFDKYFEILIKRKVEKIGIERLKPAYLLPFGLNEENDEINPERKVHKLKAIEQPENT